MDGFCDGTSTLDLVDPSQPTLLVCNDPEAPTVPISTPAVVRACDRAVWTDVFQLQPSGCLIVGPDQHIAFGGTAADALSALDLLFTKGDPDFAAPM